MRYEEVVDRVFWSAAGGAERDDNVPAMAKALRETGYEGRTSPEDGSAIADGTQW